jgi:hypothetical protein
MLERIIETTSLPNKQNLTDFDPFDPGTNAHNFTFIQPAVQNPPNSLPTVEETISPSIEPKTEVNIDTVFRRNDKPNYE